MLRNVIYDAILDQLNLLTAAPFNLNIPVISRDFKHWADSPIQPCIFLVEEKHQAKFNSGIPLRWTMEDSLWIYAKKDPKKLGIEYINDIMDALETLLMPPVSGVPGRPDPTLYTNTLNGLVQWCAISGQVDFNGGYLGDQAVARMTLETVQA